MRDLLSGSLKKDKGLLGIEKVILDQTQHSSQPGPWKEAHHIRDQGG